MKIQTLLVVLIVMSLISCATHARGNQEEEKLNRIIGVSLPEQRSTRWVRDKFAMEQYARDHDIQIQIRFSDNDENLQAYQIRNLVNAGIVVLIVAAESSDPIRHVLEYAHEKKVFVMAYDTMISNTQAIDFYIAFSPGSYRDISFGETLDASLLQQVVDGTQESILYANTIELAQSAVSMAYQFIDTHLKARNYQRINNGSKNIPTLIIEPIRITKQNYKEIIENMGITSILDL